MSITVSKQCIKTGRKLVQNNPAWQNGRVVISSQQPRVSRVLLCVVLSMLLHVALGLLILLLPPQEKVQRQKTARKARPVRIVRTPARKEADAASKPPPAAPRQPQEKREQKSTVKTSADTPQALPDMPEYEGRRNTRAASAPDARHRASAEHAPAMDGEEKKELVTFEQDRQEGDLQHEGRKQQQPHPTPAPQALPEPTTPPAPAPADGLQHGTDTPDAHGQHAQDARQNATPALTLTPDLTGTLNLQQHDKQTPRETGQQAARKGIPGGTGSARNRAATPRRPRVFYDPSLAEWAQPQKPGFRTHERRSRSNGRFILGRGAALNVTSTPRGAYEALVYRRVAHFWYIACDDHRGDIIPGKITISLRIDKRGRIDSMALIKRSGASISQQSFTFKAIRKATLPPMPPEVQADVIGPLMELIFEFNFD